jgi:hypothetical protein
MSGGPGDRYFEHRGLSFELEADWNDMSPDPDDVSAEEMAAWEAREWGYVDLRVRCVTSGLEAFTAEGEDPVPYDQLPGRPAIGMDELTASYGTALADECIDGMREVLAVLNEMLGGASEPGSAMGEEGTQKMELAVNGGRRPEIALDADAVIRLAPHWEYGHEMVREAVTLAAALRAGTPLPLPPVREGDHPLAYASDCAYVIECASYDWRHRKGRDGEAGVCLAAVARELRAAIADAAASGAWNMPVAGPEADAGHVRPSRRE